MLLLCAVMILWEVIGLLLLLAHHVVEWRLHPLQFPVEALRNDEVLRSPLSRIRRPVVGR